MSDIDIEKWKKFISEPSEPFEGGGAWGNLTPSQFIESKDMDYQYDKLYQAYLNKENEIDQLRKQLAEAQKEIEVLRQYGNKDCTAMADEALKEQSK